MKVLKKRLTLGDTSLRRFIALICLGLFLSLELLSSVPALHKLLHSDADSAAHHCAITLFNHGNVQSADTSAPIVIFLGALLFSLPILRSAVFSPFDYCPSSSRAPPAA
jgi:hypothetical protein